MARQFFGTDGVRGTVGEAPITPDFVLLLGQAAGRVFARRSKTAHATVLIGKDTRVSGYMLEAALQAGFSAAGVDIVLCGPVPTPAVAYLTRALRLDAGVVISASHNPYHDNGIKFFSADGTKLPDAVEEEIHQIQHRRAADGDQRIARVNAAARSQRAALHLYNSLRHPASSLQFLPIIRSISPDFCCKVKPLRKKPSFDRENGRHLHGQPPRKGVKG